MEVLKNIRRSAFIRIVLILFFVVFLVLPLIRMFVYVFTVDVKAVVTSYSFAKGLLNSLLATTVATVISVVIAFILSWCISRTTIKLKPFFSGVFAIPMLVPSMAHAMGLIILFGKNGLVTRLFESNFSIYGFDGVVIGSVLYSFPIAYLMFKDVLMYEDWGPYEASFVLGLSAYDRFKVITLPYLKKPLISIFFVVFSMIITDYGVPIMLGSKFTTLPVIMYTDVIGLLDFGKGSVIGVILLVPALVSFIIDYVNKNTKKASQLSKSIALNYSRTRNIVAYVVCSFVTIFILGLISAFITIAFVEKYPHDMSFSIGNLLKTLNMRGDRALLNSFIIAIGTTAIGVALVIGTAYFTARMSGKKLSKLLHLAAITSLAVPGLVLGIAYVIFFNGSFLYGTLAIVIIVNIIHFFSSPYLILYNTFGKINDNLEAVGSSLGVGRFRIVKDVILPQALISIIEVGSYFFVNSMITISAVSFLVSNRDMPISLMINQFQSQMLLECAAVVTLLILISNIAIKTIVYLIKKLSTRNCCCRVVVD